ncbi:hypothetical protein HMPREF1869_00090 [Bacteroidales bacterium KA00251]|nr:hypothetical protein HMPREF1869_00090 [Bacteroidales bacterium KA00251]
MLLGGIAHGEDGVAPLRQSREGERLRRRGALRYLSEECALSVIEEVSHMLYLGRILVHLVAHIAILEGNLATAYIARVLRYTASQQHSTEEYQTEQGTLV